MKKIITSILLCFTLTFFTNFIFAQTGKIAGKVIDSKSGEVLIGVKITIEGTITATSSDYEGKFSLNNLKPGNYNLLVSYVGYSKKVITEIDVKAKDVTFVNILMVESTKALNDIVIRGEVKKESANALLIQQKNASSVSSGVSADLIRRTPDRTTADVLKRISGASVQDNKFAIIRGLSDRYNMAFINGAPLPSTESDRKAFSLDIIPEISFIEIFILVTSSGFMLVLLFELTL